MSHQEKLCWGEVQLMQSGEVLFYDIFLVVLLLIDLDVMSKNAAFFPIQITVLLLMIGIFLVVGQLVLVIKYSQSIQRNKDNLHSKKAGQMNER
jgi:hypothetical protein